MSIDYHRVAETAGLDQDQAHHFVRGALGDSSVDDLFLSRDRFNRLQLGVEYAESARPAADSSEFGFFISRKGF